MASGFCGFWLSWLLWLLWLLAFVAFVASVAFVAFGFLAYPSICLYLFVYIYLSISIYLSIYIYLSFFLSFFLFGSCSPFSFCICFSCCLRCRDETKQGSKQASKQARSAHPFAHVFDPKLATACQQHRTRDYWHHDPETRTWTRFHLQPRKKLYDPANEGGEFSRHISGQRITRFDHDVTFHGCPSFQAVSGEEGATLVDYIYLW